MFLDEIGELAPEMQSKLLLVMEENSFERVGEAASTGVDIRVISATNIDLALAMAEGRLRRDLYYRLGSVVVRMPALRERKSDIPLFVDHFIHQFAKEYEIRPPRLSRSVVQTLHGHSWPGNIRELRNVVSRMLLHSLDSAVTEDFVLEALHQWEPETAEKQPCEPVAPAAGGISATGAALLGEGPVSGQSEVTSGLPTLEENERNHIERALRQAGGRISGPRGAAALLGVPRSTLQHRMRKLDMVK